MSSFSASAWVVLIIGTFILLGGSIYTLLIATGKRPDRTLENMGVMGFLDGVGNWLVEAGIYRPFEYMDRGNNEKATGLALIFVILLVGWQLGAFEVEGHSGSGASGSNYELVEESWSHSAYTSEGETTSVDHQFEGRVNTTTFTLSWNDDDTTEPVGYQNQPDSFRLTVVTPWGDEYSEEASNGGNGQGSLSIDIELGMTEEELAEDEIDDFEAGNWEITVECTEAGNSENPIGGVAFVDDGNEWDLDVEYTYYKEVTGTGGILD